MDSKVGIIANPASGKDIRRLVAYGIVLDNMEKIDVVRQMISGADSVGVDEILIMPDTFAIGWRALDGFYKNLSADVSIIDMPVTATEIDSIRASQMMDKLGVGCILTLGGDGTNRAAAKGSGETPLLPVAAGTNNVFPYMVDGTVAGLAAGILAKGIIDKNEVITRSKKLNVIKNGKPIDIALVDIAVYDSPFEGAKALWDLSKVKQVIATRGHPIRIGMTSIIGNSYPTKADDERGVHLKLGKGEMRIKAPVGPGIVEDVELEIFEFLNINDRVEVSYKPSTVALDGEREIRALERDDVEVELLKDGPFVVDYEKVLNEAVKKGFFIVKR